MTRILAGGVVAASLLLLVPAIPAAADTLPPAGCDTTCTAILDTPTDAGSITIPAGIAKLTVTIAGAQGADGYSEYSALLGGVGGLGGVTTVDLGTEFAGQTLEYGAGALGIGSYLQTDAGEMIVIAGGGGQGGYGGRFDLPDQISGGWAGGAGGAPTTGVADGQPGTAPLVPANNGLGGTALLGGLGGTGTTNGSNGSTGIVVTPTGAVLPSGGAPAVYIPADEELQEQRSGAGGTGFTGGGSGAIDLSIVIDENPFNVAAPGGGGSGWLADGFVGVPEAGNEGTGYLILTWTFPPKPLPATGGETPVWVPWFAAVLLLLGTGALLAARRRRA